MWHWSFKPLLPLRYKCLIELSFYQWKYFCANICKSIPSCSIVSALCILWWKSFPLSSSISIGWKCFFNVPIAALSFLDVQHVEDLLCCHDEVCLNWHRCCSFNQPDSLQIAPVLPQKFFHLLCFLFQWMEAVLVKSTWPQLVHMLYSYLFVLGLIEPLTVPKIIMLVYFSNF